MSLSELAVDRLRQCLTELIPTLLNHVSNLRAAHPPQLLPPFSAVHDTVRQCIDTTHIKDAFGLLEGLSTIDKDGPEVRIRNLCLEISNNELRRVVLESPSELNDDQSESSRDPSQSELISTFDRLDIVLALSLHDLIDPNLPLSLVEELIESHPVSTSSKFFGYIESRVESLTIDLHPTRGKGLVLLRTCNELLRRLSKPSQQHTVFAGRILSLLAKVFPLGERSGVNLRGDFNVDNKTFIEDRSSAAEEELQDGSAEDERDQIFKVDYEFYELFWKVQRFFSNPPLLMGASASSRPSTRSATPADLGEAEHANADEDPAPDGAKGAMAELRISTRKILKLFGAVTKREKELAGAASAEESRSSASKGSGDASQAGSRSATPSSSKRRSENANGTQPTGYFVGRFLGNHSAEPVRKRLRPDVVEGVRALDSSSDDAMIDDDNEAENQEVASADSGHFFPTYLTGRKLFEYEIRDTSFRKHILIQYLVLFQYLLSFTPAAKESWKDWKNKALQALFTLEDADERWIRSTWREIQALIREIQPDGRLFLESVLEVLKREANWIRWKTESCPSIEKPPLSPEQISTFATARALLLRKPEPYPHKLGTAALSELWLDGLKPPVPGTRRVENEMGEYVTVTTDGLEELEFLPPIPSLEHYNKSIQREKMKLDMRKKQLGVDAATDEAGLSKEDTTKLENDERIQATIETMQSLAWRALRVACRDNLHLFGKLDRPENIEGLLHVMEEERNPKPKPKPAPQAKESATAESAAYGNGQPSQPSDGSTDREDGDAESTEAGNSIAKQEKAQVALEPMQKEVTEAATGQAGEEVTALVEDATSIPVTIPAVPPSPSPQPAQKAEEGIVEAEGNNTGGREASAKENPDNVSRGDKPTDAHVDDPSGSSTRAEATAANAAEQEQDVEMSEATP